MDADGLNKLVDERDIVDTAIRYAWALDMREWHKLDDVFVENATVRFMGDKIRVGRDAIKDRISTSLNRMDVSQHMLANHEVTLQGDTARHRCYIQAQHVRSEVQGEPFYIVAGRYEDDMIRTPDGWRILHRELIMMWADGNDAVIRK